MQRLFLILLLLFGSSALAIGDVVKPALIEISVHTDGAVEIEIRASIEALLTGINAQYKNTQDAPTAAEYDEFRVMPPDALQKQFASFQQHLLKQIYLEGDGAVVPLTVNSVSIPEPGYTKVPRISIIKLRGELDRSVRNIQWYYPARFGDNAVRVRQIDKGNEKWHWSEWQWLRKDNPSQPFSLEEIFTRRPITSTLR